MQEKHLEDLLCQVPEHLFGPGATIVGRQVRLSHGIVDLVVLTEHYDQDGIQILVVELKARSLEDQDIGQVTRYTHYVRQVVQQYGLHDDRWWQQPVIVTPVLVGLGANDKLFASAEGAGIAVHARNDQRTLAKEPSKQELRFGHKLQALIRQRRGG